MKKRYSFWTMFKSLKNAVSDYLKVNHIDYELSGALADYYFSIYCTDADAEKISAFIDSHTITEQ